MFEVFSGIYFVVYNLYYVDQNDNLGTHVGPIHRDGGSRINRFTIKYISIIYLFGFTNILYF
jgi:hypothetical protein